jgi:hypothetical protein
VPSFSCAIFQQRYGGGSYFGANAVTGEYDDTLALIFRGGGKENVKGIVGFTRHF